MKVSIWSLLSLVGIAHSSSFIHLINQERTSTRRERKWTSGFSGWSSRKGGTQLYFSAIPHAPVRAEFFDVLGDESDSFLVGLPWIPRLRNCQGLRAVVYRLLATRPTRLGWLHSPDLSGAWCVRRVNPLVNGHCSLNSKFRRLGAVL